MPESFRYSDLQRAYYSEHQEVSLNDIVPAPERGPDGLPIPAPLETIKLTSDDARLHEKALRDILAILS